MREAKKIRLTNLTQTPGSLEPTLTSDKFVITYEGKEQGWFEISARPPNIRPSHPFSVHHTKVDFVVWKDEENENNEIPFVSVNNQHDADSLLNKIENQNVNTYDMRGIQMEDDKSNDEVGYSPCPVPGCTKFSKHRGRHVISKGE